MLECHDYGGAVVWRDSEVSAFLFMVTILIGVNQSSASQHPTSVSDALKMRCYTATRIYLLPLKPSIPKSPPFPLSSSLKGSLMLPVLALHNCVYKALIFCSSASITAVLLANDTNVACWASREDDIANETLFS